MLFNSQKFIKAAFRPQDSPALRLQEIILCGRSNVGKSSFINSLFRRKDLAKVSSTPGKTRSINYYSIDDKFYIVDLPGFGYAKVSKDERRKWSHLVNKFLETSDYIRLAIHFIDCRHKPTDLDITLNEQLNRLNIPYIFLLSKTDKLTQRELYESKKILKEVFSDISLENNVIPYSSLKGSGRKEISYLIKEMFY